MAVGARPPQLERPSERGWWLATDGRWWPPETQPPGGFVPQQAYGPTGSNGMGVAALVLGILSVVFGLVWVLAVLTVVLAVVGLVLGLVGRSRATKFGLPGGLALAGVILSIVGIALAGYGFWVQNRVVTGLSNIFTHLPVDADATANDIRIQHCNTGGGVLPRADGTLVNHATVKQSLRVTIGFVDATGVTQSTGSQTVSDVEPGHSATWSVTGYGSPTATTSCVIGTSAPLVPPTPSPIQPVTPTG